MRRGDAEKVLGLGFLMGVRFTKPAAQIQKQLLENKIITGLSEDPHVMRLLPPLVLKREEIDLFLSVLIRCLSV